MGAAGVGVTHSLLDALFPPTEQLESAQRLAKNWRTGIHLEGNKPGRKTNPDRPPMPPAETMRRYRERRKGAPLRAYVRSAYRRRAGDA